MSKIYQDILIVGAGVSGTALYYALDRHVSGLNVRIIDRYPEIAMGNSKATYNSQTLHAGDIETNYDYQEAIQLQKGASALKQYCLKLPNREQTIFKMPKMVLAVGEQEIQRLAERYQQFKPTFPKLEWFDWQAIRDIEPTVALKKGHRRPDEIAGMGYPSTHCAINYQLLAQSFIEQTHTQSNASKQDQIMLGTTVKTIKKTATGYLVEAEQKGNKVVFECRFLVFSASAYSLYFAKMLGLGEHLSLLSAAGSFFYSSLPLRGKVYTMQLLGLPFAAVHGDPDIATAEQRTRFGPTLHLLPKMERYAPGGYQDYFKCIKFSSKLPHTIAHLSKNPMIWKSLIYNVPLIRKQLFARYLQSIVPDITTSHLQFASGVGGSRPLLVDHEKGELLFGDSIITGDNAVFNVAPPTGASTCLSVAMSNLDVICEQLNIDCDSAKSIETICA